jgi:hypothetical protein
MFDSHVIARPRAGFLQLAEIIQAIIDTYHRRQVADIDRIEGLVNAAAGVAMGLHSTAPVGTVASAALAQAVACLGGVLQGPADSLDQRMQELNQAGEGLRNAAQGLPNVGLQNKPIEGRSALLDALAAPADWRPPLPKNEPAPQYVDLVMLHSYLHVSKRKMERLKAHPENPMPDPDIEGGGGKKDWWIWSKLRPWLQEEFGRILPERFPDLNPPAS